jgi:hypothetical protein
VSCDTCLFHHSVEFLQILDFHNKYDHTKSSEYKKDGRPFLMDLGNYNLTGFFSYDNISVRLKLNYFFSYFETKNKNKFSSRNCIIIFSPQLLKNKCLLAAYAMKEWYEFHAP